MGLGGIVICFSFPKFLSKYLAFLILWFAIDFALGISQLPTTAWIVSSLELYPQILTSSLFTKPWFLNNLNLLLIFKLFTLIKKPFILYIVGTYINSNKGIKQNFIKNILVQIYCHYYEVRQKQIIKQNPCIVNSLELFNKYSEINEDIKVIKSTTLSKNDFFFKGWFL